MQTKYEYDIRQIDAWVEDISDDGQPIWTWNESWHIGTLATAAQDHRAAFRRWVRRALYGRRLDDLAITYDGDIYELVHKDTGEPILAAIPNF